MMWKFISLVVWIFIVMPIVWANPTLELNVHSNGKKLNFYSNNMEERRAAKEIITKKLKLERLPAIRMMYSSFRKISQDKYLAEQFENAKYDYNLGRPHMTLDIFNSDKAVLKIVVRTPMGESRVLFEEKVSSRTEPVRVPASVIDDTDTELSELTGTIAPARDFAEEATIHSSGRILEN